MATINGTAAGDTINGSIDGDFLYGLEGNDLIWGGGAADLIDGGADDDQLFGENGNDIVYGGIGWDVLSGGDGSDELHGGDGNDVIGDDSGGADKLYGEDGNDNLSIWRYSEYGTGLVADGGAGDDKIWFAIRALATISVSLGSGNDLLQVDSLFGTATVSLGDGQDVIRLDATAANYQPVAFTITDFQTGAGGDRLSWTDFVDAKLTGWDVTMNPFATGHLRLLQNGADTLLQIDANGGGNSYVTYLTFQNTLATSFTAFNLGGFPPDGTVTAQTINGTAGADALDGAIGADAINGLDGGDRIYGNAGNDTIDGGGDNDELRGENGNDLIYGGTGFDALDGGAGNDELHGGDDADALTDDSGSTDKLYGEGGNDNLSIARYATFAAGLVADGGAGDDRVWLAIRTASTIAVSLGTGADTLQIDSFAGTATVSLGDGQDTIRLDATAAYYQPVSLTISDFQTGPGGDRLVWTDFLNAKLTSWDTMLNPFGTGHLRLLQSGADTLLQIDGNGGGNGYVTFMIFANTNAASFTQFNLGGFPADGSAPGQTLTGTAGSDQITGSIGSDTVNALDGSDMVLAGGGNDIVDGGGDNDDLRGENGNDTLSGGLGSDFIDGGEGNDELHGGDGADNLRDDGGATDRLYGEDGDDYLSIARYSTFATGLVADGGDGDDTIWIAIRTASTISISGGIGADTLEVDSLSGNATVSLGAGQDVISLLERAATFQPGSFVVTDFETGDAGDRLSWNEYLNARLTNWNGISNPFGTGHLRLLQSGTDVLLQIDANGGGDSYATLITFSNRTVGSFTQFNLGGFRADGSPTALLLVGTPQADALAGEGGNDVIYGLGDADQLTGNGGDDILDGGAGADTLTGGLGNDVYVIDSAADQIVELAGQGTDEVRTGLASYVLGANLENLRANNDANHDFRGNAASNAVIGGNGNDTLRLQDGGDDIAYGKGGVDSFYFGGAFNNYDFVDGGDNRDSLILQGNYNLTLVYAPTGRSSIANIEGVSLVSGKATVYGDLAGNLYSYTIKMIDENVAAGGLMKVNGFGLAAGENFTFDGSAELDAPLQVFAGMGKDIFKGGAQGDSFIFAQDGRFGAGDTVDGGGGYDLFYLRGDYVIDFNAAGFAGSLVNIESIALLTSANTEFAGGGDGDFDYNITWNDAMLAAGATLTINGSRLQSFETFVFNGSAETNGFLRVFGGAAADTLTGGGGNDQIHGGGGADILFGGGGADLFRYSLTTDSVVGDSDTVNGFVHGEDKIDVSRIDAKASTADNEAFAFISSAAFSGLGPAAPGELRAVFISGSLWRIEADVNGDAHADFFTEVNVVGGQPLTQSDFLL